MRFVLGLWLWCAAFQPAWSQGPLSKLTRFPLFGHEYTPLAEWAKAHNLEGRWTRPNEEFTVSSRWSKLVFTVDSRKAELNGVNVWLSAAIARHNGGAAIAVLDLTSLVHPVLFPTRNRPGNRVRTICLDAGHGGKDPGNQEGRQQEKKFTLLLAKETQKLLKEAGFKVVLTRTTDKYIELDARADLARRNGADLFVSLHYNAATSAEAKGAEVYCLTPPGASSTNARGEGATPEAYPGNRKDEKNVLLAYQLQKALKTKLGVEDRGVKRARFAVLRNATMPAALVESGFMTEPGDAKQIYDALHRRQLARAIVDGIKAYKRAVER